LPRSDERGSVAHCDPDESFGGHFLRPPRCSAKVRRVARGDHSDAMLAREAIRVSAADGRNELAHSVVTVVNQAASVLGGDGSRFLDCDVAGADLLAIPDEKLHAV